MFRPQKKNIFFLQIVCDEFSAMSGPEQKKKPRISTFDSKNGIRILDNVF